MGCGCNKGGGAPRNTGRIASNRNAVLRSVNTPTSSPPVFGMLPVQHNNPNTLIKERLLIEKRRRDLILQALGKS